MHEVRDQRGKFVSTRVKNLVKNIEGGGAKFPAATVDNVWNADVNWDDGRRLIELGVLGEGLAKCAADDCDNALDLRNTVSEKRFGLGAILWVRCECGELNRVPTGSITKIIRKVYQYMTSIAKPQRECCMLVYPERLWKDVFPLWKYLSLTIKY